MSDESMMSARLRLVRREHVTTVAPRRVRQQQDPFGVLFVLETVAAGIGVAPLYWLALAWR